MEHVSIMTNELLAEYSKLCNEYGHKSPSVFEIEFRRMVVLEAELESQLEDKVKYSERCEKYESEMLKQEKQIKELQERKEILEGDNLHITLTNNKLNAILAESENKK